MTFVMLYILFVCPFHSCGSPWMPGAGLWVLVFLPLFVLDVRRYRHAKYLKHNASRFPPYECLRYSLLAGSESIYRLLLFIRLAIPLVGLPLSVSIIPFIAGYVVQFFVGTSGFMRHLCSASVANLIDLRGSMRSLRCSASFEPLY